jgi:hypothetical protein
LPFETSERALRPDRVAAFLSGKVALIDPPPTR